MKTPKQPEPSREAHYNALLDEHDLEAGAGNAPRVRFLRIVRDVLDNEPAAWPMSEVDLEHIEKDPRTAPASTRKELEYQATRLEVAARAGVPAAELVRRAAAVAAVAVRFMDAGGLYL